LDASRSPVTVEACLTAAAKRRLQILLNRIRQIALETRFEADVVLLRE